MAEPFNKHKLSGIGEASAALVLAALSSNPATAALAVGFMGKIIYFLMSKIMTYLASSGLVLMNIGAERLSTAIDKAKFDGSFESAERLIDEIRRSGKDLTPNEIKEIDDRVIESFRKFGKLGRKRN